MSVLVASANPYLLAPAAKQNINYSSRCIPADPHAAQVLVPVNTVQLPLLHAIHQSLIGTTAVAK